MAASAATVWEVRTTGSVNNGGGWVVGATGVDYSQQDSPQYALTGVTSAGAGNTILTVSAANDMVGNFAKAVSGTNFTVGWFQITSVVVGVSITCATNAAAASICTGVGASGVVNIGGALAGPFDIQAEHRPGNTIHVRKGTYIRSASDTLTVSGGVSAPVAWIGYNSSRGDLDSASYNLDGSLVTTDYPVLSYDQTFVFDASGRLNFVFRNLKFVSSGTGVSDYLVSFGQRGVLYQCYVENPSTNAAAGGIRAGTSSIVENCDASLTGASGGAAAILAAGTQVRLIGNRVLDSPAAGISLGNFTGPVVLDNVCFAAVVGPALDITGSLTTSVHTVRGNTFQGKTTGIQLANITWAHPFYFGDNHITDCTTGIISLNDAISQIGGWFTHNRFRDNTTNVDGFDNWRAVGTAGEVTLDTGGPSSDYVDVSTNQYRLIPTAPGVGKSLMPLRDIGALQHDPNLPSEDDVRDGVVFGAGSVGTVVLPDEGDVLLDVQYGADGTEFTGTLDAGGGTTIPLGG